MSKSETMYSKSPKISKDKETGKPKVEKGIKAPTEADAEDMGVEGNPIPGSEGKMPIEVHEKMTEMLERHQNELKDMQKRHSKEASKLSESKDNK